MSGWGTVYEGIAALRAERDAAVARAEAAEAEVARLREAIETHRAAGKRPFGERTTQYPSVIALRAALADTEQPGGTT